MVALRRLKNLDEPLEVEAREGATKEPRFRSAHVAREQWEGQSCHLFSMWIFLVSVPTTGIVVVSSQGKALFPVMGARCTTRFSANFKLSRKR